MADLVNMHAVESILRGNTDVPATTWMIALVDDTCDIDDQDQYMSSIGTLGEIDISGYSAGHGKPGRTHLTTLTANQDFGNDEFEISCATVGWTLAAGVTVAGAIIHTKGTSDDTDALILRFCDLTDTASNGGRITVTPGTFLKGTYS